MIVTTTRRHTLSLVEEGKKLSEKLQAPFVERGTFSIDELIHRYGKDVLVVGKSRYTAYNERKEPFYFHPNAAMLRSKHYLRTKEDPLIAVTGLKEGMSFLDCTFGLGADSIIAQMAVGKKGTVFGMEASPLIYTIVQNGLQTWEEGGREMIEAMRRLQLICKDHTTYLQQLPSKSFDVVYFDPMFSYTLPRSVGLNALKSFAIYDELSKKAIVEAKRVAKKRVVLKDHWRSERFKCFQFEVKHNPNRSFHYGVIEGEELY